VEFFDFDQSNEFSKNVLLICTFMEWKEFIDAFKSKDIIIGTESEKRIFNELDIRLFTYSICFLNFDFKKFK
jgi:hypothetical protein